MAGCGRGEDPTKPSDEEQVRLRKQALRWLTAELAGMAELAARDEQRAPMLEARPPLAHEPGPGCGPRRPELKKLPEAEQADWRKLWTDVAALQRRLEAAAEKPKGGGSSLEVAPPPRPIGR